MIVRGGWEGSVGAGLTTRYYLAWRVTIDCGMQVYDETTVLSSDTIRRRDVDVEEEALPPLPGFEIVLSCIQRKYRNNKHNKKHFDDNIFRLPSHLIKL
jgi:hypothetical protein